MVNGTPAHQVAPQPGRVLLIDDDAQVSRVYRRMLEQHGHTVFEAANGVEGLAAAETFDPEIVLLDLNLPVLSGMETLSRLVQRSPDLPVVIISGSGDMRDAIGALKAGAWDYLIKPLPNHALLTQTVEVTLERARLIRANQKIRRELEHQQEQMREDEAAGRKVQAKLFPPESWDWGGYTFRHRVIPSLSLSGDFVDYFAINDDYAGFYCADVSGHGVSSALITVLVKSLVGKYREHHAERHEPMLLQPELVLTQLNKELFQAGLGKHLTMLYGVLDRKANSLCYASGGQYPPALLFTPGTRATLETSGVAVGLFPAAKFHHVVLPLPDSFRLVVFSDGALETLSQTNAEERLEHLGALNTRDALRQFVAEAASRPRLPDDFTLVSITRGTMP